MSATLTLRRVPRQQRSRDRLDAILDAAAELLATSGPDGTTITAVAERAGLATSSVYDYVVGDRELIGAVAERGLDRIHRALADIIGRPESVDDLLAKLSIGLGVFLDRYQSDLGVKEAIAFADADPELMTINLADTRRNAALISDALQVVHPGVDGGAAILLLTHLTGALAHLASRVDDEEAQTIVEEFERLVFFSVANLLG